MGEDGAMTPPVIQRWIDIIDNHRPAELDGLLAADAVFHSPAVFTPQEGKAKTAMYLRAAERMFAGTDFQYVGQWFGERSAVLEFTATLDGVYVDGVDMIAWNDDEKIVSFKVMIRPFKAIQLIMPKMAELLAASAP
jgi:SnoaL-like protein